MTPWNISAFVGGVQTTAFAPARIAVEPHCGYAQRHHEHKGQVLPQ